MRVPPILPLITPLTPERRLILLEQIGRPAPPTTSTRSRPSPTPCAAAWNFRRHAVVIYNGGYAVYDGNHRCAAARLLGRDEIKVEVIGRLEYSAQ